MTSDVSNVKITLEYKLIHGGAWKSFTLTPAEFFELESGEYARIDSVPRHNHGTDYLGLAPQAIRMTRITIVDDAQKSNRVICETFWNSGQNRVIERTDRGVSEYWEMILKTRISEAPPTWEILRLGRQDGTLIPLYHGFIRENRDGSETETKMEIDLPHS
jgi:hypothetical protein